MARNLNKVLLIGNITKDPELKTTQSGSNYVIFSIATNRSWKQDNGEKKEETEYHRIIAWDKLGDIISKYSSKGKKVYIEGRLATRKFIDKEEKERTITEIVASDVIFLDKKPEGGDTHE